MFEGMNRHEVILWCLNKHGPMSVAQIAAQAKAGGLFVTTLQVHAALHKLRHRGAVYRSQVSERWHLAS